MQLARGCRDTCVVKGREFKKGKDKYFKEVEIRKSLIKEGGMCV